MASDEDIQLSDMLESYPAATTPGFQTLMTAKHEFAELASDVNERLPPGRGKYFKHQKFTHRMLRIVDDLLILSETGTGKSCEVQGFTEYTRSELDKARVDPSTADEKVAHFKRVIVLVAGPTQKNEFRTQLICKCSDGHYETPMVKNASSETSQKSNITLEIKRAGYEVKTYRSFASKVAKQYPATKQGDADLAEEFADTIFWVDEAHNLSVDLGTGKEVEEMRVKEQTYTTIHRVFHLAKRSKRIISSATPMINSDREIGPLMNLILPLDGQVPLGYNYRTAPDNDIRVLFPTLPATIDRRTAPKAVMDPYYQGQFPNDYPFKSATVQDMEPRLRGRVVFIRAADTGAVIVEEGAPQNDEYEVNGVVYRSQLVLYTSLMSDFQTGGYLKAEGAQKNDIGETVKDQLYGAVRQASNFVFPDGYWGNGITDVERRKLRTARDETRIAKGGTVKKTKEKGKKPEEEQKEVDLVALEEDVELEPGEHGRAFRRYVVQKGNNFTATPDLYQYTTSIDNIKILSCKYAQICQIVRDEPGNAFAYGEYVAGSGAIVLALCLQGLGFERYNESQSMFLGLGRDIVKPVCASADRTSTERRIRPDVRPKMRYALLTGATTDAQFASMMEAMNSYENRHGEYIKVLIASRTGRDAISISNVTQIHLIGAEWNQSAIYQALSRGIRATSHEDLIQEQQQALVAQGRDPSEARVEVKIYKHTAVANTDTHESIDLQMYRVSEYKDRTIKRIMRIMKQCAIGCRVHYSRNVRDTDVDGSPTCDYDVCKYECVDPAPEEEDYSTYDVRYSGEVVTDAMNAIKFMFRYTNTANISVILDYLQDFRRKYVIMALERLVSNKIPLLDRYGYTSYLREDNSMFYLDRTYPTNNPPSYSASYYTDGVIAIEQNSLTDIVATLESEKYEDVVEQMKGVDLSKGELNAKLDSMSLEGQVKVLEDSLLKYVQGNSTPFVDAVVAKYSQYIFYFHDPVVELNRAYDQLAANRPKRGRKPKPGSKPKISRIVFTDDDPEWLHQNDEEEIVYLHNLYGQAANQTSYASTARYNKAEGRTRILKPSKIESGWRDLNDIEIPIYNIYIQWHISKRSKPFEKGGKYGFILNGVFKIRDPANDRQGGHTVQRGQNCTSWDKPELYDMCWEFGVPAPIGFNQVFAPGSEDFLRKHLLEKPGFIDNNGDTDVYNWDLERLVYYYKWYNSSRIFKPKICELIAQRMRELGRLRE
jgi:hypothetical protein